MAKSKVTKKSSGKLLIPILLTHGSVTHAFLAHTATKGSKKLTPYTKYMKTELAKVKADNPSLSHQDAFKKVAVNWATAKENPKRTK